MNAIVTGERVSAAIRRASSFFSFVIGLGISVLLFHRNFVTVKTPALPLKEMIEKIVKVDGKCFRYRVEDASCETSSST
jgi:hypothetical protein